MSNKYDVIIIGAGIGGLICGTRLAKNGLKVLIIEKHDKPGGCVTSIKRKGVNFDMGAHLIGSCNRTGIFGRILHDLGVEVDFIQLDPSDRFNFNGEVFEVPKDLDDYIAKLKAMFPSEEKKLDIFIKDTLKIFRTFTKEDTLERCKNVTYDEYLNRYFNDSKLKGILSAQSLYVGLPSKRVALLPMVFMLISYWRDGAFYPRQGTQSLPDALMRRFKALSGDILLNNEVSKIIIQDQKVSGVIATNSIYFSAHSVVSNADAASTFLELVGKEHLEDAFIKHLQKLRYSFSSFLFYCALENAKDLELLNLTGWHHAGYDINDSYRDSFCVFIPTLLKDAVDDIVAIEILRPFPYDYDEYEKWDNKKWQEIKSSLERESLDKIKEMLGAKVEKNILFYGSAGPRAIMKYTKNTHGAIYGWEMAPDQILQNRLDNITPIENLYLAGHWTNPGCGVATVAVSGWRVGNHIVETFNKVRIKI